MEQHQTSAWPFGPSLVEFRQVLASGCSGGVLETQRARRRARCPVHSETVVTLSCPQLQLCLALLHVFCTLLARQFEPRHMVQGLDTCSLLCSFLLWAIGHFN